MLTMTLSTIEGEINQGSSGKSQGLNNRLFFSTCLYTVQVYSIKQLHTSTVRMNNSINGPGLLKKLPLFSGDFLTVQGIYEINCSSVGDGNFKWTSQLDFS